MFNVFFRLFPQVERKKLNRARFIRETEQDLNANLFRHTNTRSCAACRTRFSSADCRCFKQLDRAAYKPTND